MNTPAQNDESKCTCKPKNPHLRNGSGHYEGCPLWYPLNTPPQNEAPKHIKATDINTDQNTFVEPTPPPVTENEVDAILENFGYSIVNNKMASRADLEKPAKAAITALLEQARREAELAGLEKVLGESMLVAHRCCGVHIKLVERIAELRKEQA